jgi:hypothetical protein
MIDAMIRREMPSDQRYAAVCRHQAADAVVWLENYLGIGWVLQSSL